jgi:hypothetical protein
MSAAVEIAFGDEVSAVGYVGNVLVSVTRNRQLIENLRRLRKAIDAHFKRWPGGVATISVLEPSAYSSMVSSEEREEISALARDYTARGVALVIEGTGFRPAAVRVMISGVYLVTRVSYPRKIFSTVTEGSAWLTSSASAGAPGAVDSPSVLDAVEVVRKAITRPAQ